MCYCIFAMLLFSYIGLQAEEKITFSKSQVLSLSPEEMVFASKLSDENRHRFCYTFSIQERAASLEEARRVSPNESVEKILALSRSSFQLTQNLLNSR